MNKLLYLLLFLSYTFACLAQNKSNISDQVSLSIKAATECTTYNFGTIKDLEENLDLLINEIVIMMEETTSFPLIIELKSDVSLLQSEIRLTTSPRATIETVITSLCSSLQKIRCN